MKNLHESMTKALAEINKTNETNLVEKMVESNLFSDDEILTIFEALRAKDDGESIELGYGDREAAAEAIRKVRAKNRAKGIPNTVDSVNKRLKSQAHTSSLQFERD